MQKPTWNTHRYDVDRVEQMRKAVAAANALFQRPQPRANHQRRQPRHEPILDADAQRPHNVADDAHLMPLALLVPAVDPEPVILDTHLIPVALHRPRRSVHASGSTRAAAHRNCHRVSCERLPSAWTICRVSGRFSNGRAAGGPTPTSRANKRLGDDDPTTEDHTTCWSRRGSAVYRVRLDPPPSRLEDDTGSSSNSTHASYEAINHGNDRATMQLGDLSIAGCSDI
ncbi:hypothetical protein AeMF1_019673 [Aphanomyces euteiches]|nr:hypothetical protein AeMF1_019673 [Aphanomyces euteiches]